MPAPIESYLKNVAQWYMERYTTSTQKMRRYLIQKAQKRLHENIDNNETIKQYIENILAHYTEMGYLNDNTYAQMQIRKLLHKGTSLRKIEETLHVKGIHKENRQQAKDAVEEEYRQTQEELNNTAAVQYAKRKKLGRFRHKQSETEEESYAIAKKELAKMMTAGFPYAIAKKVLAVSVDVEEPHEDNFPWTI